MRLPSAIAPLHQSLRIAAAEGISPSLVRFALFCIFTLALLLRLWHLPEYRFNPDEGWHLFIANHPSLAEVARHNYHENVHPPLYYLILSLLMRISDGDGFLRLFSVACGVSLIPVWFVTGRYLAGSTYALICAFCAAFWQGPIIQSVIVREYMLLLLFVSIAFYAAIRFFDEAVHWRRWLALYAAASLLAFMSQYSGAIVTFALGIAVSIGLLINKQHARQAAWIAVHLALAGLCCASFLHHDWLSAGWADSTNSFAAVQTLIMFIGLLMYVCGWPPIILTFIFFTAGMEWLCRRSRALMVFFILLWATAVALNLAGLYPISMSRHCIYAAVCILPVIAYAVYHLCAKLINKGNLRGKPAALWALALGLGVLGLLPIPDYFQTITTFEIPFPRPAADEVAAYIRDHTKPGDVLIMDKEAVFVLRWGSDWKDEGGDALIGNATFLGRHVLYQARSALLSIDANGQLKGGMTMDAVTYRALMAKAETFFPPHKNLSYVWVYAGWPVESKNQFLMGTSCYEAMKEKGWVGYDYSTFEHFTPKPEKQTVAFVAAIPSLSEREALKICGAN